MRGRSRLITEAETYEKLAAEVADPALQRQYRRAAEMRREAAAELARRPDRTLPAQPMAPRPGWRR